MRLEIIAPDKEIFAGEVSLVQLPGIDGLFEVLSHHAPMISALRKGKVKLVDTQSQTQFFDINGGVAEILNDKVLVLAE